MAGIAGEQRCLQFLVERLVDLDADEDRAQFRPRPGVAAAQAGEPSLRPRLIRLPRASRRGDGCVGSRGGGPRSRGMIGRLGPCRLARWAAGVRVRMVRQALASRRRAAVPARARQAVVQAPPLPASIGLAGGRLGADGRRSVGSRRTIGSVLLSAVAGAGPMARRLHQASRR